MNIITPLVTVIIPTYNREKYVSRAIESAQHQLYKNIEIIVVDDGSTDNTAEVVKQFKDVKYIYKKNGRQASARNAGLKVARGEFICTLDSDDYWHPDFLTKCVSEMLKYNLEFVFANSLKESGKENVDTSIGELDNTPLLKKYFTDEKYLNQKWIQLDYEEIKKIYLNTCPAPSSALVFKRESIVGNWEESIKVADDWEFVLRIILAKKCGTSFCKIPLWTKHVIGDNVFESLNNNQRIKSIIVHDHKIIINNNIHNLSKKELHQLNQHRINICFLSIYHNLIIKKNVKQGVLMTFLMFRCSPYKAFKKIFHIKNILVTRKVINKFL